MNEKIGFLSLSLSLSLSLFLSLSTLNARIYGMNSGQRNPWNTTTTSHAGDSVGKNTPKVLPRSVGIDGELEKLSGPLSCQIVPSHFLSLSSSVAKTKRVGGRELVILFLSQTHAHRSVALNE